MHINDIVLKNGLFLYVLLTAALFFSCSDNPVHPGAKDISLEAGEHALTVTNRFPRELYYFAVEWGRVAQIQWTPASKEGTGIPPGGTKKISYDKVYGYRDGTTIIFYYWIKKNPSVEEISFLTITP
ncbi:MAG: hypothetical protein R3281_08625 [Balneolaceae bacterium]|nr:hypothetical protein [Balneolaceae bacterium]